jgi:hypothetical protein
MELLGVLDLAFLMEGWLAHLGIPLKGSAWHRSKLQTRHAGYAQAMTKYFRCQLSRLDTGAERLVIGTGLVLIEPGGLHLREFPENLLQASWNSEWRT